MGQQPSVDVCVVGAGAGGAVVAWALGKAGLSVAVLEAGPRYDPSRYPLSAPDWEVHPGAFDVPRQEQDKHRYTWSEPALLDERFSHLRSWSEKSGLLITSGRRTRPRVHRVKGVGGTTLHYQGEAHRFSAHGFQAKSRFGYGEDWPLGYEDLAPYYERMEALLGVSGDHRNPFKEPRPPFPNPAHELSCASRRIKRGFEQLGLHLLPNSLAILSRPTAERPACNYCNGCSLGCMMRAKSSADVSLIPLAEATGRVTIRSNCTAAQITLNRRGLVDGVSYFDEQRAEHWQQAKAVVLCAGALESPRLLLNSRSKHFPDGLANRSRMVGQWFMETIEYVTTGLFAEPLFSYKGLQIDSRAWDYNDTQEERGFLGGVVLGVSAMNLLGPAIYAQTVARGWGKAHKDEMRRYFGSAINVFAIGEHHPHPDNRVTLDPNVTDAYGLPVAKISTRLGSNELHMLQFMQSRCRAVLEEAGAERRIGEESAYDISSISHMGGTCRMGHDPSQSVVNPFGRTHDVANLFVADGSVFVTQGGGDSPSLTIQAFALRTADYLAHEARAGSLS